MSNYDNAIASGIQALTTIGHDVSSRAYSRKQNRQQRDHEVFMWHAQNAYNHPLAQRKRLEEAGLNPNLMYGSGSVANTADSPKISPRHIPETKGLQGVGQAIGDFMNRHLEEKKIAQNGLAIEQQGKQIESNITKQSAETAHEIEKTANTKVQAEIASETKDAVIKQAYQDVNIAKQKELGMFIDNVNKPEQYKVALMRTYAEIDRIGAQIDNINASTSKTRVDTQVQEILRDIKMIEHEMWKQGINPNKDSATERFFMEFLNPLINKIIDNPSEIFTGSGAKTILKAALINMAKSRMGFKTAGSLKKKSSSVTTPKQPLKAMPDSRRALQNAQPSYKDIYGQKPW